MAAVMQRSNAETMFTFAGLEVEETVSFQWQKRPDGRIRLCLQGLVEKVSVIGTEEKKVVRLNVADWTIGFDLVDAFCL